MTAIQTIDNSDSQNIKENVKQNTDSTDNHNNDGIDETSNLAQDIPHEPYEFTHIVKIATDMYADKLDIHDIVAIVKDNELQIDYYYRKGMTIEKAIAKATNITSSQSLHIEIHPSDFSDINDNDYDDLYDDSGMVYKSKQFSNICKSITSGYH